jgi:hypothetical protein
MLLGKKIEELTEDDLRGLVAAQALEGLRLDFKRELPAGPFEAVREFLADVSSFANTDGGHLVYGVEEAGGAATDISGVVDVDRDATKLRLTESIRSGIAPRLDGVTMSHVALADGRSVLVIEIPRSFTPPHMVSYRGSSRFFARTSAGSKYQMDVQQIRNAFIASETINDRLRDFRVDRVARIIADDTPSRIVGRARLAAHIMPLQSFTPGFAVPVNHLKTAAFMELRPFATGGESTFYNFDGILQRRLAPEDLDDGGGGYVQLFRNGCIESVSADMFGSVGVRGIPSKFFEPTMIRELGQYLHFVSAQLRIGPPYIVAISLLGVRGFGLILGPGARGGTLIDRDNLLIPDLFVDEVPIAEGEKRENFQWAARIFQPVCDTIWNACGFIRSGNYDAHNQWALMR